ncbi:hypothetical protein A1704_03770 [Chryseobacterium cucumeris]|uniref:hypothetical protein n=1 Tax=Chryseobacterium cucumeris TaxID=1813611 RepID=UPI000788A496|nr:hypothetical protein [Chryseobacterium cucumeris]KYH07793.1 hypothetical protein A1704_03770 [Chryseobacterium cucumeris]
MAKRVITKIGDIFSIILDNGNKKYFQYIANDLTQLNSDVIRSFKREYSKEERADFKELLSGEIDFHAHTPINIGVKQNLYIQDGKHEVYPDIKNIIFRGTNDSGHGPGKPQVFISENWHIWRIGDEKFTLAGKLEGENRKAEIGSVIPPFMIVERVKTGKFNFVYPDFE